jgi:aryl-alcohol dehydrogenase-like predicted oxidoreductase
MTFGEQNSEADGHVQLDYAVGRGITLFDASEVYPVPPKPETQGRTEAIIGSWLAARKHRDQVMIATKVAGRGKMTWLRKDRSATRHSAAQINEAVEASLKRLKTDYIDLYQLHWPDRPIRVFEGLNYVPFEGDSHSIHEILGVLATLVTSGKVRFVGLSNETPWGLMSFLKASEQHALPRPVSIQNAYNLVNRTFEIGLSEVVHREQVGLLAYSPLGQGYLTGKYEGGALPAGSRKRLFDRLGRYERATGRAPFRPMWRWPGGMGSTRRRWRSPSRCHDLSSPAPSSGRPAWTSSRPISTPASSSYPQTRLRTSTRCILTIRTRAPDSSRRSDSLCQCPDCFPPSRSQAASPTVSWCSALGCRARAGSILRIIT